MKTLTIVSLIFLFGCMASPADVSKEGTCQPIMAKVVSEHGTPISITWSPDRQYLNWMYVDAIYSFNFQSNGCIVQSHKF